MTERDVKLRPEIDFVCTPKNFEKIYSGGVLMALKVAEEIHKDDRRKVNGEPYVHHCVAVASILGHWGADEEEIIAGLLHDTVEDHPNVISLGDIARSFGPRVAHLVDGVTKLKSREGEKNEFETLRKVTKESVIEPGVALIKLADRWHNMTEMDGMPAETQSRKAKETLSVYAPLAESFGLWQVKNALQDLAFKYIDPKRYALVRSQIDSDPRLEGKFIEQRETEIKNQLKKYGIEAIVEHQVGGYWEMSERLKKFGMRAYARPNTFADITDVISFRVLVDDKNLADCYKALGATRLLYGGRLMKERHDDYLITPAVNGYSAAHDTYHFEEGDIEVAFSTKNRELFNNWGVVSLEKSELKKDADLYKRKLIFTPKKELVFMEMAATGIDVAYKLNPLLGLRAVGIIIDGRMYGLDEVVPNASVVEILRNQEQIRPNPDWLEFCNQGTRRIIEQQLRVSQRDEEVSRGKALLAEEILHERGILNLADLDGKTIDKLLIDLGCWYGLADLYYKVAYGFDLNIIRKKLDDAGIVRGMYTSVLVVGDNEIGVSKSVAEIVSKYGGDARSKVERVDEQEKFSIRILLTIDYDGKKKMEQELKEKYPGCVVV